MDSTQKNITLFILYFALSTILTWWFVAASPLYISEEQMFLSTAVAGGKWGIQILLALTFLGDKRWKFIKEIGFVCFIGSCILLPYPILSELNIANDANFFLGSLIASVLTMIFLYFRAVKRAEVYFKWFIFWLICLDIAIFLQLTVVFHYIEF